MESVPTSCAVNGFVVGFEATAACHIRSSNAHRFCNAVLRGSRPFHSVYVSGRLTRFRYLPGCVLPQPLSREKQQHSPCRGAVAIPMRPNGAPPPVLPTLERALHIQSTAASPLLEPRLKAALGIHRSSSVARRDAQPAELQEHPSQLSLAEKRQDWRKRRREVQLSKLFQADKRQDWRKRRQKPWRLNLYSVTCTDASGS